MSMTWALKVSFFFFSNDNPVTKLSQTAASWKVARSSCVSKKLEWGKKGNIRKKESLKQAEKCSVPMYTWQRESGEGLGPFWSYAMLCDKVAQDFLLMNFNRGKRWISLSLLPALSHAVFMSLSLYLSFTACVYPPTPAIIQERNSCR